MKRKRESDKGDILIERDKKIRKLTCNNILKRPEKRIPHDSRYIFDDIRRTKRRKYNYGETLLNNFGTQLEEYKRMKRSKYKESKVSTCDVRERIGALTQYRNVNNILRICHIERRVRITDRPPPPQNHQYFGRVQEEEEMMMKNHVRHQEKCADEDEEEEELDCLTDITLRSYEEDVEALMEEIDDEDVPW